MTHWLCHGLRIAFHTLTPYLLLLTLILLSPLQCPGDQTARFSCPVQRATVTYSQPHCVPTCIKVHWKENCLWLRLGIVFVQGHKLKYLEGSLSLWQRISSSKFISRTQDLLSILCLGLFDKVCNTRSDVQKTLNLKAGWLISWKSCHYCTTEQTLCGWHCSTSYS